MHYTLQYLKTSSKSMALRFSFIIPRYRSKYPDFTFKFWMDNPVSRISSLSNRNLTLSWPRLWAQFCSRSRFFSLASLPAYIYIHIVECINILFTVRTVHISIVKQIKQYTHTDCSYIQYIGSNQFIHKKKQKKLSTWI